MTSHTGMTLYNVTDRHSPGKRVLVSAAATLKRVTLGVGGMTGINLADAEPEKIDTALLNSMLIRGQGCIGLSASTYMRNLLQRNRALVAIDSATKVGEGLDEDTTLVPLQNQCIQALQSSGRRSSEAGEGPLRGVLPNNTKAFLPCKTLLTINQMARARRQAVFGPIRSVSNTRI